MTKSQSMPCHVTSLPPDPFPELSQHKMRLYHFQDMERPGDRTSTSGTSETGRTSPSAMSSATNSDVSACETTSATDSVTQVLLSILVIIVPNSVRLQLKFALKVFFSCEVLSRFGLSESS